MFLEIILSGGGLFLSLIIYVTIKTGFSGCWFTNVQCKSKAKLNGKTVIITGSSAGIGKEAARDFANRGAKVILACRNPNKAQRVADDIQRTTENKNIHVKILDTSSLTSVRTFAKGILEEEDRLDILALNAGIAGFKTRVETGDGLEMTVATNHFGHFLLTHLLMGLMKKTGSCRIVVTSSGAHNLVHPKTVEDMNSKGSYNDRNGYHISKIYNVMFTKYLAFYLRNTNITVNCFCPGFVRTEIFEKSDSLAVSIVNYFTPLLAKSATDGAQTLIYLAVSEEVEKVTGCYFYGCKVRYHNKVADDVGFINRIWKESEQLVQMNSDEKMEYHLNI